MRLTDERPETFFGHAWAEGSMKSAMCNVDASGKITYESYNLSDSTGEHSYRSKHGRTPDFEPILKDLRARARADAIADFEYAQARRRETSSPDLRYAFLVTWGRGGTSVYIDARKGATSTLQGYGFSADELAEIERLQIPFIDTRTIPDDRALSMISLPLFPARADGRDCDAAPYGPLSVCPIPTAAALYAALGATVRYIDLDPDPWPKLRGATARESALYSSYSRGDEIAFSNALASE